MSISIISGGDIVGNHGTDTIENVDGSASIATIGGIGIIMTIGIVPERKRDFISTLTSDIERMLISEALQDALREKKQIEKENEELKKVLNEIYAMIAKAIKY